MNPNKNIRGKIITKSTFHPIYYKNINSVNKKDFKKLIEGRIPIIIIENVVSYDTCKIIKKNFKYIIKKFGSDRVDHVPVNQVGPNQFGLSFSEYINKAEFLRKKVNMLFDTVNTEKIKSILGEDWLGEMFKKLGFTTYRPSKDGDHFASQCLAREWRGKGELVLKAHTDNQQVYNSPSNGELLEVDRVLGYNFCLENSSKGGNLIMWNIEPDISSLKILDKKYPDGDLMKNGYPYPIEELKMFEKIEIPIKNGYCYILNGHLPHAVSSTKNGLRLTLTKFIGLCSSKKSKKVIYWT